MNKELVEKSPEPEENVVEEATKRYYQLKGEYMKKYQNSKKKITSQDISKQEMKNKLKNMKIKCLNCKQFGGMVFSEKNRILSAKCGNQNSPCQLDLQIKLPKFMTFQQAAKITQDDINTIKKIIIDLKLDLLFGLKTEEEIQADFEENKTDYKHRLIQLKHVKSVLDAINTVEITNIVTQKKEDLTQRDYILLKQKQLMVLTKQFKSIISQYMQEDGFTQKNDLMKEAIELYNEQIFPLMELIRHTKYDVTIVEQEGEQFVMKQVPILPSKYDFEYEEGEILKDIK
jgi:hypothetical protein